MSERAGRVNLWRFLQIVVFTMTAALPAATDAGRVRAADDSAQGASQEKQRKLIGVLRSDASPAEKAIVCKQLAVYGDKEAVPALAPFLSDESLASWARIALEAIPGPAADEALRQAAGKLQGRLLVGVINSIAVRRDAKAVDGLVPRLKDSDVEVAAAAAVALGRIGNAAATRALVQSLGAAPPAVRSAIAAGCILAAERLLADGKAAEAVKLYDLVRMSGVPKHRVLAATRGAILARQPAGVPLLIEQLQSADKAFFALGLQTAREMSGREVTAALVAELGCASPDRQALLVLALADRGDSAALPAVLQAAKGGSKGVRVVALGVLKRLGDASYVPVLLEAALEGRGELSQTAVAVLAELPGKAVDADLATRLSKAEGKSRSVLIQIAGRRRIAAAVPALLKAAEDPDPSIRTAALAALGSTVELQDLQVLIARVATPVEKPAEAKAAEAALCAACERMPDREACAEKLAAAMSSAPVPVQCRLMKILSVVGGVKALQAIGAAAKEADPELKDAGSQLLGEWMTVDAAPLLLDLAKSSSDAKYQTRALRGYIRLARQFAMPNRERCEMCRLALAAAKRDAERKLVLAILTRYPSLDMLKLAIEAAKTPSLKADAARALLVIAQKIGGHSTDVAKLLAQVGHDPIKVEILKAEYGANGQSKDVTEMLRKQVRGFPLILLPSPDYNTSFGGDPAPGTPKQLKIRYRLNGKEGEVSFPESATILLQTTK